MMLVIAYATSVQKNIMMGALASLCFVVQPILQFIVARLEQRFRRQVAEKDQTGDVWFFGDRVSGEGGGFRASDSGLTKVSYGLYRLEM